MSHSTIDHKDVCTKEHKTEREIHSSNEKGKFGNTQQYLWSEMLTFQNIMLKMLTVSLSRVFPTFTASFSDFQYLLYFLLSFSSAGNVREQIPKHEQLSV